MENCQQLLDKAGRWQSRIVRLLTHHEFRLKGDDVLYVAGTVGDNHAFGVWEFVESS